MVFSGCNEITNELSKKSGMTFKISKIIDIINDDMVLPIT